MTDDALQLKDCPLFERLGGEGFEKLRRVTREFQLAEGELIFRQGEPCEGFYVVLAGAVRVYKLAPDGRERTLHVVRPPHAFAEAAIFGSGTYPAFAQTLDDSRLVCVLREPFIRLLQSQPEVALGVIESMGMWMHRLLDQLENETFLNARAKLASWLLREGRRQQSGLPGGEVLLQRPRKDIASELGMAPETFSRAQADLEGRGLIRPVGQKTITLLDPDGLENLLLGG